MSGWNKNMAETKKVIFISGSGLKGMGSRSQQIFVSYVGISTFFSPESQSQLLERLKWVSSLIRYVFQKEIETCREFPGKGCWNGGRKASQKEQRSTVEFAI